MTANLFHDGSCELGEGPLWYDDKLYWFDINASKLFSLGFNESLSYWQFNEPFSAAAKLEDGHLLLASATGLWKFSPESGDKVKLVSLESDNPMTRSNDGRADRQGGFWIGTMGLKAEAHAGAIYRFYKGKVTQLLSDVTIPNSLCFSPEGSIAYFTDTKEKTIYKWYLDEEGWPQGEPEVFIEIKDKNASPDGSVVDAKGFVWNAQWGASRVVRYSPEGKEHTVIHLSVSQPSCPAFGGDACDTLFVTSAREGLSKAELFKEKLAGSVFSYPLTVSGLAEPMVKLA